MLTEARRALFSVQTLGLLAIAALMCSCTTKPYKVFGAEFPFTREALDHQSKILTAALERVTPTAHPVHGRALVLLPSADEIQRNHIRISGDPTRLGIEGVEFLKTGIYNELRFVADAIERRAIFDALAVARHNGNPARSPSQGYDYLIYADVDGWFVKTKTDGPSIHIQRDKSPLSTVDSVERIAREISLTFR